MNIKKIIKEEIDDFNWVGDVEPMEPGMEFLKDNFDNLKKVIKDERTFYVDSKRKPLFYYYQDSENRAVYINYGRIWSILEKDFGLSYNEIQELITRWLEGTYNLRGLTPYFNKIVLEQKLEGTYNLMGLTPKFITSTLNLTKSYLSSNK
jgi:hypothetical protein